MPTLRFSSKIVYLPVDEAASLLPLSPNARSSLFVTGWIPVRIKEHQPGKLVQNVSTDWVKSNPNLTYLLPPMRLMPQPPALLLSRKTKAPLCGLLNWSTMLVRLLALIEPSRRSTG